MAMPVDAFPQHPDNWTLGEVLALPEDQGQRIELVDGALHVSPAPTRTHQRLLHRIQMAWDSAMPPEYECCRA